MLSSMFTWIWKVQQSNVDNYWNANTSKTIKAEDNQFELISLRDKNGTFEAELVKKN